MMNLLTFIRSILFFFIFTCQPVLASDHPIPSRLIIGFHHDAYRDLGGAKAVTDYINSQWGKQKPVSLVRPMGNSSILVEVNDPDAKALTEITNKLMQLDKIRYVNEDQPVNHYPATDISIPTLQ